MGDSPATTSTAVDENVGGGVWAFDSANSQVLDCLITNGCAARGAAVWRGRVQRCVITGNRDISGGMRYSDVRSSLVVRNPDCGGNAILGHGSLVQQCTVVGVAKSETAITGNLVPVTNTVAYQCSGTSQNNACAGTYVWETTYANAKLICQPNSP